MDGEKLITLLFGITYERVINKDGLGEYYVNGIEVDYFDITIADGSYIITITPKRIIKK